MLHDGVGLAYSAPSFMPPLSGGSRSGTDRIIERVTEERRAEI